MTWKIDTIKSQFRVHSNEPVLFSALITKLKGTRKCFLSLNFCWYIHWIVWIRYKVGVKKLDTSLFFKKSSNGWIKNWWLLTFFLQFSFLDFKRIHEVQITFKVDLHRNFSIFNLIFSNFKVKPGYFNFCFFLPFRKKLWCKGNLIFCCTGSGENYI